MTCPLLVTVVLNLVTGTAATPAPVPGTGYHHLGATTVGTWSGVLGRMSVTAPGVRDGTYDFVASRFMVKADTADGTRWLEAGWAQTGWSGRGRQRVYTFDTNSNRWIFYDQYPLKPGDRIEIQITAHHGVWVARLLWHGAWWQLTSQVLPFGEHALVEQYVEVYVDPRRGGRVAVPPVHVDGVQLEPEPGAAMRSWQPSTVPTDASTSDGQYCLAWHGGYDTWAAGSCPAV